MVKTNEYPLMYAFVGKYEKYLFWYTSFLELHKSSHFHYIIWEMIVLVIKHIVTDLCCKKFARSNKQIEKLV